MDATRELIMRVRKMHNPEFDVNPGGPPVTWVEVQLVNAVGEILVRTEKVERENISLLNRVGFLESKLTGFIKYGAGLHKSNS